MQTTFIRSFLILLLTFTMSACQSSEEESASSSPKEKKGNPSLTQTSTDEIGLYGEVSEIIGNEVTLRLIEKPEKPERNGENSANNDGRKSGAGSRTGDGSSGGVMRERKYTGEEVTFIIPVGAPLVTVIRGEDGREENEISLNEVTSGSVLSVYYQKDSKTIEKIKVQKPRTGGGQGGRGAN
ncbi:hypothetical protein JOC78_002744 [Bacillus ectoiniformans]|uniref:hypothetical protein n=1 Tax=Bacillus ectoiniformans TaxID=1494429 RepID=UPI00195C5A87|nr:hypothetical protein [Bacillus ectoiniformans]MBM7649760.1 hypothetical protein [Bacillus ectoiniformans]